MAVQATQTDTITRAGGVRLMRVLTPIAGVVVSKAPAYLLPTPIEIAKTFIDEFPRLLRHGWVTTYEMLLGYLLAVAIAVPLGITNWSKRCDEVIAMAS